MTAQMTKDTFVSTLRSGYAAWESILNEVPEERMTEPGAAGEWSVKDLIAHVTFYEKWTVEWLEPALRGAAPEWTYVEGDNTASLDERNRRSHEQNRDRSLEDIRAESADVHAQLAAVVEQVPDDVISQDVREFAQPVGDYYDEGTTVWEAIDGNAAEHYREHTADVRAWLQG